MQSHINLTGHITEMLLTIVSGQTWNKLSDADKKTFEAVLKEAGAKAIGRDRRLRRPSWSTSSRPSTRRPWSSPTAQPSPRSSEAEHLGSFATWDKATYDRLQAIK